MMGLARMPAKFVARSEALTLVTVPPDDSAMAPSFSKSQASLSTDTTSTVTPFSAAFERYGRITQASYWMHYSASYSTDDGSRKVQPLAPHNALASIKPCYGRLESLREPQEHGCWPRARALSVVNEGCHAFRGDIERGRSGAKDPITVTNLKPTSRDIWNPRLRIRIYTMLVSMRSRHQSHTVFIAYREATSKIRWGTTGPRCTPSFGTYLAAQAFVKSLGSIPLLIRLEIIQCSQANVGQAICAHDHARPTASSLLHRLSPVIPCEFGVIATVLLSPE